MQPTHMQPTLILGKLKIYSPRKDKLRLTHDALYNVHELAYDLEDFVKIITTYPDLIIICGLNKLITELKSILQTDSECPQLLSYDTTFQLGD